jgi:hypothetical protein
MLKMQMTTSLGKHVRLKCKKLIFSLIFLSLRKTGRSRPPEISLADRRESLENNKMWGEKSLFSKRKSTLTTLRDDRFDLAHIPQLPSATVDALQSQGRNGCANPRRNWISYSFL